KPRYEVVLSSQVSGKVEWVAPRFVAGGRFNEGDELIRIEQEDYQLAVKQAQASVAGASYALAVAKANSEIAQNEWETMQSARNILGSGSTDSHPDALVLREPQLHQAEANLVSAEATLELAELRLSRTVIFVPFNCIIRNKSVDPGQNISMGAPIGMIFSTDMAEIEVGIPISELLWMEIPGASATVSLNFNDGVHFSWDGRVDRNVGVIDERERLARVVVRVNNPYRRRNDNTPVLSVGTFVEVEIEGREITDIIPMPRKVIREGSTVWIALPDKTLEIRHITVDRMTATEALISGGLRPGERVITSQISGATTGLKVRTAGG
ncbi:MAG: efflux RND transporter periplasmic adaptor subunit, partial [Candidatus Electryoneaceae bacterium]|nr:efflux RND transporter periplasmic adaptor subunit [Candidatus Electryoneaceae bacterium]